MVHGPQVEGREPFRQHAQPNRNGNALSTGFLFTLPATICPEASCFAALRFIEC